MSQNTSTLKVYWKTLIIFLILNIILITLNLYFDTFLAFYIDAFFAFYIIPITSAIILSMEIVIFTIQILKIKMTRSTRSIYIFTLYTFLISSAIVYLSG